MTQNHPPPTPHPKQLQVNPKTKCSLPITVGTIPLLSDIVSKAIEESQRRQQQQQSPTEQQPSAPPPLISPTSTTSGEDAVVQVTITDESGRTGEMDVGFGRDNGEQNGLLTKSDLDESLAVILSKKRVRMPSSILSELYPSIPSPYYRQGGRRVWAAC